MSSVGADLGAVSGTWLDRIVDGCLREGLDQL